VDVTAESDNLDPAQCALLVLDCQPEALASVVNARSMVFRTNSAIDVVRRLGGQIGFTRLAFEDSDYRFTPSTNKEFTALAHERWLRNGTSDADLHPGLTVAPDDIIVRKTRLGAFSTTNLDEHLTNLGITTLILAGVHASGAILSTIREAADKDYRLIVLADCISDTDTSTQQLLMERVFPRQAEVLTTGKLERALASQGAAGDITVQVG
jgi:nicotinamidase-related amidase